MSPTLAETVHPPAPPSAKYKRVLLKISGEALMGERDYGLDPDMVNRVAGEIKAVVDMGVEVCIVIGGGIFSVAWPVPQKAWTAPQPITWACWPPLSTHWLCKMLWNSKACAPVCSPVLT